MRKNQSSPFKSQADWKFLMTTFLPRQLISSDNLYIKCINKYVATQIHGAPQFFFFTRPLGSGHIVQWPRINYRVSQRICLLLDGPKEPILHRIQFKNVCFSQKRLSMKSAAFHCPLAWSPNICILLIGTGHPQGADPPPLQAPWRQTVFLRPPYLPTGIGERYSQTISITWL